MWKLVEKGKLQHVELPHLTITFDEEIREFILNNWEDEDSTFTTLGEAKTATTVSNYEDLISDLVELGYARDEAVHLATPHHPDPPDLDE